jgi:small subunit ribosomal protein S13e
MLIKKVRTITHDWSCKPAWPTFANICKAVAVRKHLERNRKDKDSKFRLILIESRIHRLSRYYKTVGVLPPTWRYESATASTLVA